MGAFRKAAAVVATACIGFGGVGVAQSQEASPVNVADALALIQSAGVQLPELPANPGESKQLVAFGDSFTANSSQGVRPTEATQLSLWANCSTDMENWPKIAGAELGKTVGDWSCNGTGSLPQLQLQAYVESAILYGDLGANTEDVVLMYGGMDATQWVDVAGELVAVLPTEQPTIFRETIAWVKNRVAQVAPNARVSLVSYPEWATNDTLCVVNVNGAAEQLATQLSVPAEALSVVDPVTVGVPVPGATRIQEALRDSVKSAAEHNGVNFIDVYQASIGHGTCNPDPEQRWTVGAVDSELASMPNHPTVVGEYAMAGVIANGLR